MALSELSLNLYSNASANSILGDMAANIAIQNFDYYYTTLLFFNTTVYYGVDVFLRLYYNNVVINHGTFNPALGNRKRQFVLFASDSADIEQVLDAVIEFELDNTGKFIIVCDSPVSNDCDEQDIMELCWNHRIVNIVFVRLEAAEAVVFTYFPVTNGICTNLKPVKLDCSVQCKNTIYGKIFKEKFSNMYLCPITVSTFIQPPYMNISNGIPTGADGDLLRMIIYGLNSSLKVMTPSRGAGWGLRQKNGTWLGSLADIYDELANFSMTSGALTLSRFSDFQISTSYHSAKIVWVAHPAQLQNAALKLLHPFEPDTRVALVVSFLLIVVYAFLVKTESWMPFCNRVIQPNKSIVFYSWMICMGQGVTRLPTKSVFLQMTLFWIWYCFLLRTGYQVYLISSLKGKFYEDQFSSIEDAINANCPFGGGGALKDYYIDNPHVYENWVNVETSQIIPTALNISKGLNFVLAMDLDTAKIVMKKNKINLHFLPRIIATTPTVIFFKKFSSLSGSVNLVLSRLTASGLPDKLKQLYTRLNVVEEESDMDGDTMKIVHFTACYVILILGWILSALFFSLEFYFGRIYKHPTGPLK